MHTISIGYREKETKNAFLSPLTMKWNVFCASKNHILREKRSKRLPLMSCKLFEINRCCLLITPNKYTHDMFQLGVQWIYLCLLQASLLCATRFAFLYKSDWPYSVHIQCLKAFDRLSFERRGPLLCSKNTLLRKSAWLYNESIDSITLMQIMFGKYIHRARFRQRCSSLIGKQGSVCLPTFCKTQWLPSTSYSDEWLEMNQWSDPKKLRAKSSDALLWYLRFLQQLGCCRQRCGTQGW